MNAVIKLSGMVLFSLFLFSCEKEIEFPVKEKDKLMVIQAEAGNRPGSVQVKLSESIGLYQTDFPKLSGAQVTITDENEVVYPLSEQSPGYYTAQNFTAEEGKPYRLQVLHNGTTYQANSTMPRMATIDTAYISFGELSPISLSITVKDTLPEKNYYGLRAFLHGEDVSFFSVVAEEDIEQNNYSTFVSFKEILLSSGDTLEVELLTINKQTYDYFIQLNYLSLTEFSGFFQVSAPDNPKTNLNNRAVGYFSAHAVHRKPIIIP